MSRSADYHYTTDEAEAILRDALSVLDAVDVPSARTEQAFGFLLNILSQKVVAVAPPIAAGGILQQPRRH